MARKNRLAAPGLHYHVVNRGNDRRVIFLQNCDYVAFIELLAAGVRRFEVQIFGYCLMPNHFHLLASPLSEGALSAFMQWVTGRYACTFRQLTETVGHGHVFQRRFWNAAVSDDLAFVAVLRYIEGNPVRGSLVPEADLWPWSSFTDRGAGSVRKILSPLPLKVPANWAALVNGRQREETLAVIRAELCPVSGRRPRTTGMGQAHLASGGGICEEVAQIADPPPK